MRRILSTTAFLGLLTTTASGFAAAPQLSKTTTTTTTESRQQRQQQQFPRSTLFPIKHSSSSSSTVRTTTVRKTCQPTTVNRMTSDPEEEKTIEAKDSTLSEETSTAINGAINGATNGDASPSTVISTSTNKNSTDKDSSSSSSNSSGFSMILLPTLLFKFTIVMCVKFATDIVVFPLLWLYRLARMCKRKIGHGVGNLFGGKKEDDTINGTPTKINGATKINGDGGL